MNARIHLTALASLLGLLLVPVCASAQCTGVQSLPYLVADGTPVVETIPDAGVRRFIARLHAGRSYSLQATTAEVRGGTLPYTLTLCELRNFGGGETIDTTSTDPPILNDETMAAPDRAGRRLSIVVSSSGLFSFDFTNTDLQNAHTITVVLFETTLFNPAWSTFGTFETFYSCVNTTTDGTLDATLRMFDTTGMQVASFDFTNVPAGGTVSRNTGATSLNVPNALNGSATLTHNGPPGAFKCEAAIADFATAPRVIQPVKFEPARP